MRRTAPARITVVGNVVEDRTKDARWVPGGPALYASRAATALGAEVTLVSRVPEAYDWSVFNDVAVRALPAAACPRFENVYSVGGARKQTLLARGAPLSVEDLPVGLEGDAVIAAPALDELGGFPPIAGAIRIASLQGPLRERRLHRSLGNASPPVVCVRPFVQEGVVAIFSDEDVDDPLALAEVLSAKGTVSVVTLGARGSWLYRNRSRQEVAPFPARVIDPTGAGDSFAAAFAVYMVETGDFLGSCEFANAMGSLVVERSGVREMPSRAEVSARLLQGAA